MYKNPTINQHRSYFYSNVQKRPLSYTLLSLHQYATRRHFYTEMSMFDDIPEDSATQSSTPKINPSTRSSRPSSRAWESRTNSTQGHCSWHSLRRPRSSPTLAAMPGLVNGDEQPSRSSFFYYHTKLTRNRVSLFSFLKNRVSLFSFHRFHQN
jgi:hypothetical protein